MRSGTLGAMAAHQTGAFSVAPASTRPRLDGRPRVCFDWTWLAYGWAALAAFIGLTQTIADRITPQQVFLLGDGGGNDVSSGEWTILLSAVVVAFGQGLGFWSKYLREKQAIVSEGAAGRVKELTADMAYRDTTIKTLTRDLAACEARAEGLIDQLSALTTSYDRVLERNGELFNLLKERGNLILGGRDQAPRNAVLVDKLAVIPGPDPEDDAKE
jgi:hypothetical protein